ncbi:MAG: SLC13 family permease [Firmicutes bacterium]|nr:SLC13 family permease [Bacillota bacterium]
MEESVKEYDVKAIAKIAVVIILPLLLFVVPTGEAYTSSVKAFAVITILAISLFATEVINNTIVALLLPVLYIIFKVAPANIVFEPWTGNVPWMTLGGLLISMILNRVGLLRRLAYTLIIKTGGTYKGLLFGIMFSGIIVHLIAPGSGLVPFAAITYGICIALDLGKSKQSAAIMLTGLFSAWIPHFFIYNPTYAIVQNLGGTVGNTHVSYLQYFMHNMPYLPYLALLVYIISRVTAPSEDSGNYKAYAENELAKLGSISRDEKKALFVSALLLIFLITTDYHGIDIGWGFILSASLFYLPGIDIGTKEDVEGVNYGLVIFAAACLSIGSAASHLGVGEMVAKAILPVVAEASPYTIAAMIFVLMFVCNFLLTPMALYSAFTVPLTQIAASLSIPALVTSYIVFSAGTEIVLPYEWAYGLFYFSFGLMTVKDFALIFGTKAILSFIWLLAVMMPYWKLIGLF